MAKYSAELRAEVAAFAHQHGDWKAQRVYEIPDATITYWRRQRYGHTDNRPMTRLLALLKHGSATREQIGRQLGIRNPARLRNLLSLHVRRGRIVRLTYRIPTYCLKN